jgi:hypothetical protein
MGVFIRAVQDDLVNTRVVREALLVLAVVTSVATFSSCAAAHQPAGVRTSAKGVAPSPAPTPQLISDTEARQDLARLPVGPREHPVGYHRSVFGTQDGFDTDGNGCGQRDDVLLRDAVPGSVRVGAAQDMCDHQVISGSWVDPYTGAELGFDNLKDPHQALGVQIDHVVPLAEAWVSGASRWPATLRERFANDLDELDAASPATIKDKGDYDVAAWRPEKPYQCDYARRWISVKTQWHLAVDRKEKRTLVKMLGQC